MDNLLYIKSESKQLKAGRRESAFPELGAAPPHPRLPTRAPRRSTRGRRLRRTQLHLRDGAWQSPAPGRGAEPSRGSLTPLAPLPKRPRKPRALCLRVPHARGWPAGARKPAPVLFAAVKRRPSVFRQEVKFAIDRPAVIGL